MPSARLLTVHPPGGQAGSTVEVTLSGNDLQDLARAWVSQLEISVTVKTSKVFTVRIPAETPPGVYDFRVVGKNGASNPRSFSVGLCPEIPQTEENSRPEKAQPVPLGSTVNGRTRADTIDFYRFKARQGDYIVARCEAGDIDSRLEPVLLLTDSAGRELARGRDGSSLGWRVSEDGELTVSLHDTIFRGGPEYFYRLSIGSFPRIESFLPVASVAGGAARFEVTGHNLPGGLKVESKRDPSLERIEVELTRDDPRVRAARTRAPDQAGEELFEFRLASERGVSERVLFTFPSGRLETEPQASQTPAEAAPLSLPLEIAGEFAADGKPSWFNFQAPKGEVYWMEVVSRRLGFPTDPFFLVRRAVKKKAPEDVLDSSRDADENIGGPSFNTKSLDPKSRFEAAEGGDYQIEVKDLFTHVAGSPRPAYCLMIRKPSPDFRLVAMPALPLPPQKDGKQIPVATLTLRRGGVTPVRVLAFRRDGFTGEIDLSLDGLPHGVEAAPARIDRNRSAGLIFLRAETNAGAVSAAFTITGSAEINGAKITRQARAQTLVWNIDDYQIDAPPSRSSDECVVSSVADDQPVRLRPAEAKTFEGVSGGKLSIPLTVERTSGVTTESFTVSPFGPSAFEEGKELAIDAKATNATCEIDLKRAKFPPGSYTFALGGYVKAKRDQAKGGDAEFTLYSAPITLRVGAASTNSPSQ